MADPAPSAKFKLHAPVFDGGDAGSFNLWLSQFQRYIRVTKPAEDDKLDLFLLCAGNKAAQYYNEVTWPERTQAEKDAGVTELSRAVTFITNKFVSGKNILSERIKLYSAKQRPKQSLTDFLSELRQIASYCNFPTAFADEALRDAFCQGFASDGLKRAVCRAFATATANNVAFTLTNAVSAAEVEESALQSSSQAETFISVAAQKANSRKNRGNTGNESSGTNNPLHKNGNTVRCHWCGSADLHGKKNVPAKTKSALNVAVLDTLLRFVYQSPKYLQIKSTLTVILILLRALMALNIAYADLQTSELTDATKASLLTPVVTSL